MIYRIYVEKKPEIANEAIALKNDIVTFLGIKSLRDLRILNRYDVENINEKLFNYSVNNVFSEPQVDFVYTSLDDIKSDYIFAVEYLPGQYDQRADSASQCIQIISQNERPVVKTARIYLLYGDLTDIELNTIKKYIINPVETREASLALPKSLVIPFVVPTSVKIIDGFIDFNDESLENFIKSYGLAMDFSDLKFCQEYFKSENRNPTITEIKVIDTYWSDHCRHTTFNTIVDNVTFEDELLQNTYKEYLDVKSKINDNKPVSLMNLGTIACKYLKKTGKLDKLDESEEINACTVKVDVDVNDKTEKWLLLFKNETHNHPTEIEPFGGAATCVGGAIRDPLSGRSYVYAAMRLTGAANPLQSISDTIPGKLPQRKIVQGAAAGYSSYGNQIGLATGLVDELYHPGYAAKRMEIGAIVAAAPACNVRRERPENGDVVILLGGATGRDGIGGATGSSKAHNSHSVETCGSEVQKGNAPEERKIQRLFRNPKASLLIKRCNDFGAGGVSVAIGELADGLNINLNAVPKKYDGLDGTELAISESQERMAVVVERDKADEFIRLANDENLEATVVAEVTDSNRLIMNWNNVDIVNISRDFLNTNGAEKHTSVYSVKPAEFNSNHYKNSFTDSYINLLDDLNICSKRGLSERFDSTIGANTVLMPFGGKYQKTPIQAMVHKLPVLNADTKTVSVMSWGFNPYISELSPYHGAYLAVVESVSKLIATGCAFKDIYLSFQEYFEHLSCDPIKWGKPFNALLGAFKAQMNLGIASIGGKDSMSGTYENITVPPTLVSFAVSTSNINNIVSPEFKKSGDKVYLVNTVYDNNNIPDTVSLINNYNYINDLITKNAVKACYSIANGGISEAIYKMCIGNGFGFKYADSFDIETAFNYKYGSFVIESDSEINGILIGEITSDKYIVYKNEKISLSHLNNVYENKLESVYSCNIKQGDIKSEQIIDNNIYNLHNYSINVAKPTVLIPVFPGTNCEYDSAKAVEEAGMNAEIAVIQNRTSDSLQLSINKFADSIVKSQIIFIPGGFSGGDEPDGSGKFITAFFRNEIIKEKVTELLDERKGLLCGICNGFQALIKLGLLPYGKIIDSNESMPTLTFNSISRHQSKIVHTRVVSTMSPWLSLADTNTIYNVPISHGEGRLIASSSVLNSLIKNNQIATQYVDLDGNPTYDIAYNPNGSLLAIEGITSPDGRVFGKMGHTERVGTGLYKNVVGNYELNMFKSAKLYFSN